MTTLHIPETRSRRGSFRHEALFYDGIDGFVAGTTSFIRAGLEAGEAILVVVAARKIDRLRAELGGDADDVRFADMGDVGPNPARIIPAWNAFVSEHTATGRAFRGIGEPIWAERSPDELVECERHEALLNLAFAGSPAWYLLCPYDTGTLASGVLSEAQRNHPFVWEKDTHTLNANSRSLEEIGRPFDAPLAPPPIWAEETAFDRGGLGYVRSFVSERAASNGLDPDQVHDLLLAVNEVTTNSVLHGGGNGVVRVWSEADAVVVEVSDRGHIADPLVGRRAPVPGQEGGIGMWLANQLCDLVQVRSFASGSVVRLHTSKR